MLSELQKRKLTVVFNTYDTDGNGVLEEQDFVQRVAKVVAPRNAEPGSPTYDWAYNKWMKEWGRLQRLADVNQDNKVSLDEWFAFHERELQLERPQLPYWRNPEEDGLTFTEFIFDIVDLDDNGKISWKEYSLFLHAYGIDWDLHQEIFQKLDLNGDGVLSKDEWVVLLNQFFGDDPDAPGNWHLGPY